MQFLKCCLVLLVVVISVVFFVQHAGERKNRTRLCEIINLLRMAAGCGGLRRVAAGGSGWWRVAAETKRRRKRDKGGESWFLHERELLCNHG